MGNKKQEVILDIFKHCLEKRTLIFDNDLVKQICLKHKFGNPFDATKIDSSDELPSPLKEEDYFIIHLGEGRHKFVKSVNIGSMTLKRSRKIASMIGNIGRVS